MAKNGDVAGDAPLIMGVIPDSLRAEFFSPEAQQTLAGLVAAHGSHGANLPAGNGIHWWNSPQEFASAVAQGEVFAGTRVLISSWVTPRLEDKVLAAFPDLELLAHTGATVRPFVSPQLFDRNIAVTQAGEAMGPPVAEVALTFTLSLLHQVHRFSQELHTGSDFGGTGARAQREIRGALIGVIGASRTGRHYISMARALGAHVQVYDPFLDDAQALSLGVTRGSLDHIMATSQIVAVHAPTLPETHHMIGARELALMPNGAGLVNTARSWLVDEQALIAEARSGRIDVAVDVFDQEPMSLDHPFRSMSNVLLTPHRAAGTVEGRLRGGDIVVQEIAAHLAGQPLAHAIVSSDLEHMA